MTFRNFACLAVLCLFAFAANAAGKLTVHVLSSRPDAVSGGSALVEIAGTATAKSIVKLNGKDVTRAFRAGHGGTLIGLLQGLGHEKSTIEVRAGNQRARLDVTNHPITGPVFSGPHQMPFLCETESAGLGQPLDTNCSAKTKVEYFYKSTHPPAEGSPAFKPFDPAGPRPDDVARTTTSDGKMVSYIVRREIGTINRAIYEIAILHAPGTPLPDPWTSAPGWNGKLVYSFGGGCSAGYRQARSPSALNDTFLSLGFASAASSLNVFGNNCDDVLSAETLSMVKEHFIKEFGPPVFTIGWGGSGGSMQQHLIAQNYPGLLDGIIPAASYPDLATVVGGVVDCSLLARAFEASGMEWTDEQKTSVSGYPTWQTCGSWMRTFSPKLVSAQSCAAALPKTSVYNTSTNPDGVRCGIFDNQMNLYGRDPATGFARRPLDNVGVQYGLAAFNAGTISAGQFVSLNEKAGGYDAAGNLVDARTTADAAALRVAYQRGRALSGGGSLHSIPILDVRQYLDPTGDIHDSFRSFATRARLIATNGNADNHVMWTFSGRRPVAGAGTRDMLVLMDRWLTNLRADTSADSLAVKTVRNKPPELVDTCWSAEGEKITEPRKYKGNGPCDQMYPAFGDPRIAAGAPLNSDVLKCALKPVDPAEYAHPLSADQLERLKAVFPHGVCDYSKPGIEQQKLQGTWLRY
jgi:hypothetical protein